MNPSKSFAVILLISLLSVSSSTDPLQPECSYCSKPHPDPHHPHPDPHHPLPIPPIVKPPINIPPITVPKVPVPPVTVPKVPIPPVTVPPVLNPPKGGKAPCTPPAAPATCPIDTLKLGACVDLLGGLVHIGLGDPAANECCPIISGLVELEAAVCLCTTLKIKALNLNIYVPLALQLLVTCGKTPPPGYTCSF
ncbi:hypothetical protein CDL12_28132 [Handroanthus impetiginosus]|uniref:Bifunctional inhibitor/plant lipid transfer protein/seed storage helical domain-containing protein n=1 Tax=Handroanthus impetiginosus TaxID=429701 RepID=A0A2G9G233_9LAMI|nr:hypothetical protein CDL12_28132 [Handroanthus impetiginosus]